MVFVDGVPQFPEHYLMNTYRPELLHYKLCGPLQVAEEFFDRISLYAPKTGQKIEVSNRLVAEALVLMRIGPRSIYQKMKSFCSHYSTDTVMTSTVSGTS